MKGLKVDAKAALRGLGKRPALLATATLCLSLGIGANATMLRILDFFFFRPPAHVSEPDSIQRLSFSLSFSGQDEILSGSTSYPVFFDLRKARTLSHLAAYLRMEVPAGKGARARKVKATLVSQSFFELLGVRPVSGRAFSPSECQDTKGSSVALLSEGFWKSSYGGQPNVLGQPIRIGQDLYTIIGIMPHDFKGVELESVDVWLPLNAVEKVFGQNWHHERGSAFLDLIGRLRPDTRITAAEEELTALYRQGHEAAGEPRPESHVLLGPVQRAWGPGDQTAARVSVWLTAVALAVLLIACANVANLLIVRSIERNRELAIRSALGAPQAHLIGLVLFEGFVLAVLGGLGALVVMYSSRASLQAFLLSDLASANLFDLRTAAWFMVLVLVAGSACGIAPVLWGSRGAPMGVLKDFSAGKGPNRARTQWGLITIQIALSLVLLVGTGLFVRSLQNLNHIELGLDPDQVLVATIDFQNAGYSAEQAERIYGRALERVRKIPSIEQASLASSIPFVSSTAMTITTPTTPVLPQLSTGGPYVNSVSEEFFSTLGTAVRRGRAFTPEDRKGSEPVAIVNETFARLVWPAREALGQCLIVGGPEAPCSTVVGVVQDARRAKLQEPATFQVYLPLEQAPASLPPRALLLRVKGEPAQSIGAVRSEIQSLTSDLPWLDLYSLADSLEGQVRPWRMGATVFPLFGVLSLILAAIGIYASISFTLAQRQHEMGIRLALGASWGDLLRRGLSDAVRFILTGAAMGLACIFMISDFVQPTLLGISVFDPIVLGGAILILAGTALTAGYFPTRMLRQINPTAVLKPE